MICEYIRGTSRVYVYNSKSVPDCLQENTVERDVVGDHVVLVGHPALDVVEQKHNTCDLTVLAIKCVHGTRLDIATSKYFLRENWEEMLDYWMCCQKEKNVLLGRGMVANGKTAFLSDFYLYALDASVPACCAGRFEKKEEKFNKIFYNDVFWAITDRALVFRYFLTFFEQKNTFLLENDGKRYEIKFFCTTSLCTTRGNRLFCTDALKVGLKQTDRLLHDRGHMNQYFRDKIWQILLLNSTDIEVLGYKVSFIPDSQQDTEC